MNGFRTALRTSVGKKLVMGITGLLLCLFLVVHLAGNMLMLVGAEVYNNYAHALHKQEWLVKAAEVGLVVLFISHIGLGFVNTRENHEARGEIGYAEKRSKIADRKISAAVAPENWMFPTGAVVLFFLILHLADFTWEVRPDIEYAGKEAVEKAVALLQTPLTFWVYLIGSLVLGWHLGHGTASAFQSLGVNHPRYNGLIKCIGVAFAFVVGLGFAFFPLWAVLR